MLTKSFHCEVKANRDKRIIEGYASTFGNVDVVGDRVEAGAFAKTLRERLPKNQVKVLRDHRTPIGLPVKAYEDQHGLYTETKVAATATGDETLALVADGVLDRMSIGYDIVKAEWATENGQDIRLLKELKLYEYSVVLFPANEEAVITGVKSLEDLEDLLRRVPAAADYLKSLPRIPADRRAALEALVVQLDGVKTDLTALLSQEPDPARGTTPAGQEPHEDAIDPALLQSLADALKSFHQPATVRH